MATRYYQCNKCLWYTESDRYIGTAQSVGLHAMKWISDESKDTNAIGAEIHTNRINI